MELFQSIIDGKEQISLVGLGYVGMPIAVAFSRKVKVIGFDINKEKIEQYKRGIDPTNEVGNKEIAKCMVQFTDDETKLKEAKFHIVAVPTPVTDDHMPDLTPVKDASHLLGRNLTPGSVVVYESTVYPGVTEEICIPILEKESHLKCGTDFKVGYSPERINPGDQTHRLETIVKVVSGMDPETLECISKVYGLVVKAGVYKAPSIKVAEAAKVIENSQRDINIAFMNELSMIFHLMCIDTQEVLQAAGTKWNFLKFFPGLVGGHCIGVDPYYLTYKAEQLGYHSKIILSGRTINDDMGKYIAECLVKNLIKADLRVNRSKVGILGFTFKENCPDTRNTKVIDIVRELNEFGIMPYISDPIADAYEAEQQFGIHFVNLDELCDLDAIIVAVSHKEYRDLRTRDMEVMFNRLSGAKHIIMDIKGIFNQEMFPDREYIYWRL